jgi:hypothetical protein
MTARRDAVTLLMLDVLVGAVLDGTNTNRVEKGC